MAWFLVIILELVRDCSKRIITHTLGEFVRPEWKFLSHNLLSKRFYCIVTGQRLHSKGDNPSHLFLNLIF